MKKKVYLVTIIDAVRETYHLYDNEEIAEKICDANDGSNTKWFNHANEEVICNCDSKTKLRKFLKENNLEIVKEYEEYDI